VGGIVRGTGSTGEVFGVALVVAGSTGRDCKGHWEHWGGVWGGTGGCWEHWEGL